MVLHREYLSELIFTSYSLLPGLIIVRLLEVPDEVDQLFSARVTLVLSGCDLRGEFIQQFLCPSQVELLPQLSQ